MKSDRQIYRGLAGLSAFAFCVLTAGQAMASGTWDEGGADSNWSMPNKWLGNAVSFGTNPIPYTFAGNVKDTSNNDLTGLVSAAFAFTDDSNGINGNITPTAGSGITKNGSGILTLSGNNTYTCASLLQAGMISLSSMADTAAALPRLARIGNSTAAVINRPISMDHTRAYPQTCLISDPEYVEVLGRLKALLPAKREPEGPKG